MIPNIDILAEELTEVEYASNTYRIVNVDVYNKIEKPTLVDSGKCGDNAIWEYYSDGGLVIGGNGAIYDYPRNTDLPWFKYSPTLCVIKKGITYIGSLTFLVGSDIRNVILPNSVTKIGDFAFTMSWLINSIAIPISVTNIGNMAFMTCENLTDVYYEGTEEQWNKINIKAGNDSLTNATIHYNHKAVDPYKDYPNHPNESCSDYYDRIDGYVDDIDAIKQAIYLILSTERYKHIIYSWDYGVELIDLYGKPLPYVMADLPRRITEALTQDDRIEDVIDFEFERNGKRLHTTFTVVTNAGNLTTDLEVEV